jgi:hypothetical protein
MDRLFIIKADVTDVEVAAIYSKMLNSPVAIGDVEYRVMDDVDNPSFSYDYPSLKMAQDENPNATLIANNGAAHAAT